jgi:hypothetical protein
MNGKLPNYSHGLQTWLKGCGITCEIDTINIEKNLNHFKFFEIYFHFLGYNYRYYFCKYIIYIKTYLMPFLFYYLGFFSL